MINPKDFLRIRQRCSDWPTICSARAALVVFLLVPQSDESRVPQVLVRRPLHKVKPPPQPRLQPRAVFHLLRRPPAPPSPRPRPRQIREWTFGALKAPEPLAQLLAHRRREPAPRPRGVHQPI